MAIKTLYTAVGRFERRTNGCNRSCPIILLGGQEYMVDMQEMVIWSMLNWRILRWDDIAQEYEKLATASGYCTERSWEDCTNRLLTRGLLVSGSGETEYDALYDLLGSLSIIPTSGPFFLRLASFVKLTLLAHVPVSAARKLFQKDKRTKYEALVMRLAGQALNSWYKSSSSTPSIMAYLSSNGRYICKIVVMASSFPALALRSRHSKFISCHLLQCSF